jgi:sugar O-acyltransferase (sialic acid O-acetyltransferase NeuD family)
MSRVFVVGAGDHGRVVLELLRAAGQDPAGFVEPDDAPDAVGRTVDGLAVVGDLRGRLEWCAAGAGFVIALGDNRARRAAFERCLELGLSPVAAVHPTAILLAEATVAPGAVVCAGAILGLATRVKADAIVNTGATLDHDNVIGAHATVAPGAHLAGRVTVGEGAFVGIGAAVREGVRIGDGAFVAGGAMVTADVPAGARVAGVPARAMES